MPLQTRLVRLTDQTPAVSTPQPPSEPPASSSQGFLVRGLPITDKIKSLTRVGRYTRYTDLQYPHHYIDLSIGFVEYQKKFSAKTRSTIKRKLKKFSKHCGGEISWQAYSSSHELRDFFNLASEISKRTYQEKLFDGGLPNSAAFIGQAKQLAEQNRIRAYILFDRDRPVSYLYCPIEQDVLIYAYLGYDPDYMQWSVGTILHRLAIEDLYREPHFRYLDFTEGDSPHKRLFATHQRYCANVYFIKRGLANSLILYGHLLTNHLSRLAGLALNHFGLKSKIKSLIRST